MSFGWAWLALVSGALRPSDMRGESVMNASDGAQESEVYYIPPAMRLRRLPGWAGGSGVIGWGVSSGRL